MGNRIQIRPAEPKSQWKLLVRSEGHSCGGAQGLESLESRVAGHCFRFFLCHCFLPVFLVGPVKAERLGLWTTTGTSTGGRGPSIFTSKRSRNCVCIGGRVSNMLAASPGVKTLVVLKEERKFIPIISFRLRGAGRGDFEAKVECPPFLGLFCAKGHFIQNLPSCWGDAECWGEVFARLGFWCMGIWRAFYGPPEG